MAFVIEDILNVKFLLRHPSSDSDNQQEMYVKEVRERLQAEAIRHDGRVDISSKRIRIDLDADSTHIRVGYPTCKDDLIGLANIIDIAIDDADIQGDPRFVFAIAILYDQKDESDAATYLGERMLRYISFDNSDMLDVDSNIRTVGGHATYHFISRNEEHGTSLWLAKFEPRFNDPEIKRVFFSLDQHCFETHPPKSVADVVHQLNRLWDFAHELIEKVDSNV